MKLKLSCEEEVAAGGVWASLLLWTGRCCSIVCVTCMSHQEENQYQQLVEASWLDIPKWSFDEDVRAGLVGSLNSWVPGQHYRKLYIRELVEEAGRCNHTWLW